MRKSRKKRIWFSSTALILILVFIGFISIGLWRYGKDVVIDEILRYGIGSTSIAMVLLIMSIIFRKQLLKLIKEMRQ